ncbi:MAG: phosphoadenylyl-sulfate reductase [Gammaproteobacteria bacterium]|nr:phosphoadenylyl-sulfate reductase [Gammaproteobacteria bacterium]MBU1553729.1 phosphoadenylyl-sulfate reductase [Gammaproteobacteria bacterium]MBU2070622.1 phosphoadenylyl-sulfate reductase [Gammaproteobacteria bacterium]MBU2181836.1 phosphoadenylyl-sulfate reductase [Gammaproteobacteria bacterium]MBU2205506.1 phosphoadenylyl-sulfate reductase [Gammaproteobacteria bacterium]
MTSIAKQVAVVADSSKFRTILQQDNTTQQAWLDEANHILTPLSAAERVRWALDNLPSSPMLSSSFGIQAAVMLHLVTQQQPDIPVVLTDTGYLFPETYQFIDQLTAQLQLNLQVYRAELSPAWQEARFGQLWQTAEGTKQYNQLNKVEPMQRALRELNVGSWFTGLRRSQSSSRADKAILEISRGVVKIQPIIDWSNKDVFYYLKEHGLSYHPLWEQGYVSVGDTHSTRKLELGMSEEDTRFNGFGRECGLHMDGDGI